jgi:hypothetical protein
MPRTQDAPRTVEQASSLVAAAVTISGALPRRRYQQGQHWQSRAWHHFDTCGELRYGAGWFANALSRALLIPTVKKDGIVQRLTSGAEYDALEELIGSSDGQSALLKAMGQHYFVAGDWYLVGRGARKGDRVSPTGDVWEVVSTEEMKNAGKNWWIDYGDGERIELTDADAIIRMWNPHPRKRVLADSPVRAVLGSLDEIETSTRHIAAQLISRLAGAGILFVPTEMTFAKPANVTIPESMGDVDPFMVSLGTTMQTAINDPGDPSALVPIIVKTAADNIDKVKHLTFWGELDQQAGVIRTEAIRRLALGLDLPPEVLLGTADVNHWGSWQIEESSIKAHIEPALEVICAALTTDCLRKVVPGTKAVVAFDTAALRLRPNRSKEALELYDRGEIDGDALRRETGFEGTDAMQPPELQAWLLKKVAGGSATPEMVNKAIELLVGVDLGGSGDTMREARPDPSLRDHPSQDIPDGPSAPTRRRMEEEGDARAAALYATCNALAYRALERAGNRLKNRAGLHPPGVLPEEMHCHVPVTAAAVPLLLDGAWGPLPKLLQGTDASPRIVEQALTTYLTSVLVSQVPHDTDRMQRMVSAALEASAA